MPQPVLITEQRILTKHPLAALTRRSIADPFEFRERLAKVREQGYVIEEGEAIDGRMPLRHSFRFRPEDQQD